MSDIVFLTHAEVEIDPAVAVPNWGLREIGRARHHTFASDPALDGVAAIYSSTERKAIEGATPVAERRNLPLTQMESLGENDRSATGFLPPEEFWPVVAEFFAYPEASTRGWETARGAQERIVAGVQTAVAESKTDGDILIVAHGGVGALLRCHLNQQKITQDAGQPHPGGGCWFRFGRDMDGPPTDWSVI
ncbi:MAG: histidine phosphatase family protein [Pseudomonadota bacterium]